MSLPPVSKNKIGIHDWPLYSTGPIEHVHALGVISLNYNFYEGAMLSVLDRYMREGEAQFFFDLIRKNEDRVAAIRHLATLHEYDEEVLGHVEHLINHFTTCQQNRNILMHSRPDLGSALIADALILKKGELIFHVELGSLRRIADQMRNGLTYLIDLDRYLWRRERHETDASELYREEFPIPALPKKPRLPRILDPHQPLASPKASAHRPKPSRR